MLFGNPAFKLVQQTTRNPHVYVLNRVKDSLSAEKDIPYL